MISAHDRTTIRRLREWLELQHEHDPDRYLSMPTTVTHTSATPISVRAALFAVRAAESALVPIDPATRRQYVDLVLADMERLSGDHAPWVGIAAVRSWISILRRARERDERTA